MLEIVELKYGVFLLYANQDMICKYTQYNVDRKILENYGVRGEGFSYRN